MNDITIVIVTFILTYIGYNIAITLVLSKGNIKRIFTEPLIGLLAVFLWLPMIIDELKISEENKKIIQRLRSNKE